MLQPEEMTRRLERHDQFWGKRYQGEGAYVAVTAPNRSEEQELGSKLTLKEQWLDLDYRLAKHRKNIENTYFAGDAVPTVFTDFGPGVLAAFLGVQCRFAEDTIWFDSHPVLDDWEDLNKLRIDTNAELFAAAIELTRLLCEDSKGDYIVGIPDIGVNLDVLASLRGTEQLLRDMIRKSEPLKSALETIDLYWFRVFREFTDTIRSTLPAVSSWVPIAGKKDWYPLMSEFSSMVSPKVFEQVSMPALQREADHLNSVLFNLDGENQIKLLPHVLELRGLHSIQWDPVPKLHTAGVSFRKDFNSPESIAVYRQIQSAGKKIVINGIRPEQAAPIFDEISPDGVFLFVKCESPGEADDFVTFSKKWRR